MKMVMLMNPPITMIIGILYIFTFDWPGIAAQGQLTRKVKLKNQQQARGVTKQAALDKRAKLIQLERILEKRAVNTLMNMLMQNRGGSSRNSLSEKQLFDIVETIFIREKDIKFRVSLAPQLIDLYGEILEPWEYKVIKTVVISSERPPTRFPVGSGQGPHIVAYSLFLRAVRFQLEGSFFEEVQGTGAKNPVTALKNILDFIGNDHILVVPNKESIDNSLLQLIKVLAYQTDDSDCTKATTINNRLRDGIAIMAEAIISVWNKRLDAVYFFEKEKNVSDDEFKSDLKKYEGIFASGRVGGSPEKTALETLDRLNREQNQDVDVMCGAMANLVDICRYDGNDDEIDKIVDDLIKEKIPKFNQLYKQVQGTYSMIRNGAIDELKRLVKLAYVNLEGKVDEIDVVQCFPKCSEEPPSP